eukprot:TRINITY_DN18093_c0_g1_i1.p1 TRINITY_DN18093_c0_g1~~TRINITY_DN18093_c0_g1_i1.p1  ORF type:complete len:108 (+),score=10.10 TRINITY_DN18093_c0_g1_i1:1558-1881(+)
MSAAALTARHLQASVRHISIANTVPLIQALSSACPQPSMRRRAMASEPSGADSVSGFVLTQVLNTHAQHGAHAPPSQPHTRLPLLLCPPALNGLHRLCDSIRPCTLR